VHNFKSLNDYVQRLDRSSFDYHFYSALIAKNSGQDNEAAAFIDSARDALHDNSSLLTGGSYERVYPLIFRAQLLAELEETIDIKIKKHQYLYFFFFLLTYILTYLLRYSYWSIQREINTHVVASSDHFSIQPDAMA
jgi:hypothetical protein